jgi:hypothetical protein
MTMRLALASSLALALIGVSAWAEGPIATAPSGAPPSSTVPPPLGDEATTAGVDAPQPVPGPCGPRVRTADGKTDQKAHGEVDVGVGTGGYRHARLSACKPIGDNAAVAVSIGTTQSDYGRRR